MDLKVLIYIPSPSMLSKKILILKTIGGMEQIFIGWIKTLMQ
jgi:hypothetical protein